MNENELKKLNLNKSSADLLNEVLEASIEADPMYIRFMAYSQLSDKPPKGATGVSLHLPGSEKLRTLPELFPHESQFLASRFGAMAERGGEWINLPGGDIFKNYLRILGAFYAETDSQKANELQKKIEERYAELLASEFPIIITPTMESYYKEPYFDPELKISLRARTPEAKKEELNWQKMRDAMAENLDVLNAEQFADSIKQKEAKSVIVVGGFGVNIIFNAVAQEKPNIIVFLNLQRAYYDKKFPEAARKRIANTDEIFGEKITDEKREFLEAVSRGNTVLHEFTHAIFPDDLSGAKKFGRRPYTIIDEVKAEICYRPLVSEIIKKGGLAGTKEEWAVGMLVSSLETLEIAGPPGKDPYFHAAIYSLNDLFKKGAVRMENKKIRILDFELYYETQKKAAEELLNLYRDPKMTEKKAAAWIKARCVPNGQVKEFLKIMRSS